MNRLEMFENILKDQPGYYNNYESLMIRDVLEKKKINNSNAYFEIAEYFSWCNRNDCSNADDKYHFWLDQAVQLGHDEARLTMANHHLEGLFGYEKNLTIAYNILTKLKQDAKDSAIQEQARFKLEEISSKKTPCTTSLGAGKNSVRAFSLQMESPAYQNKFNTTNAPIIKSTFSTKTSTAPMNQQTTMHQGEAPFVYNRSNRENFEEKSKKFSVKAFFTKMIKAFLSIFSKDKKKLTLKNSADQGSHSINIKSNESQNPYTLCATPKKVVEPNGSDNQATKQQTNLTDSRNSSYSGNYSDLFYDGKNIYTASTTEANKPELKYSEYSTFTIS